MDNLPRSLICSDPSVIRGMLIDFFKHLDQSSIPWAILGGWEYLPDYARHDVDVVVKKGMLRSAVCCVEQAARDAEWIIYGRLEPGRGYVGIFLTKWIESLGERAYFQIDLFTVFGRQGIGLCSIQGALDRRVQSENGIWHVPAGWYGAFVLTKEMLSRGFIEGELRERYIQGAVANHREDFLQALSDVIGRDAATTIADCISRNGVVALTEHTKLFTRAVHRGGWHPLFARIRFYFGRACSCFSPTKRLFVCFIGPDGCGKTTIADQIESKFTKRPFVHVWRVKTGFGPFPRMRNILANIKKLLTGKAPVFAPVAKPGTRHVGMTKPLPRLKSIFYVVYYGVSQFLGWPRYLSFSPRLPALVIADRYFYDYFFQRGFINCPCWIKKIFLDIIPKPQLLFVLKRSAEDIYAKKPELSIEEIQREQGCIEAAFGACKNYCSIDASRGIEGTVSQVASKIEEWIICC